MGSAVLVGRDLDSAAPIVPAGGVPELSTRSADGNRMAALAGRGRVSGSSMAQAGFRSPWKRHQMRPLLPRILCALMAAGAILIAVSLLCIGAIYLRSLREALPFQPALYLQRV